ASTVNGAEAARLPLPRKPKRANLASNPSGIGECDEEEPGGDDAAGGLGSAAGAIRPRTPIDIELCRSQRMSRTIGNAAPHARSLSASSLGRLPRCARAALYVLRTRSLRTRSRPPFPPLRGDVSALPGDDRFCNRIAAVKPLLWLKLTLNSAAAQIWAAPPSTNSSIPVT